jgi:hypothetical protein
MPRTFFTLFFEMPRNPLRVTVMGTQNFRWYQLEEGSSSEFGNTVTGGCCFPQKFISPISLLLQAAQFLAMVALRGVLPSPKSIGDGALARAGGGGWAVVVCHKFV